MRRFTLVAVAAATLAAGTALCLSGVAGARNTAVQGAPVAPSAAPAKGGAPAIAVGSSWTMYYYYPVDGTYKPADCDVITFITKHAWTSDRDGDAGSWSGKVTLKDNTGGVWFQGSTFDLKYNSGFTAYTGYQTLDGLDYGPMVLESGNDPMGVGTC